MTALLQLALIQPRTHSLDQHASAWRTMLTRVDAAAATHDLVVLPEASTPGWALLSADAYEAAAPPADDEVIRALAERARTHGCAIAAGVVFRGRGGGPSNGAILLGPDGALLARTAEHHPAAWFDPGEGAVLATVAGVPMGIAVGHDLRARTTALTLGGARVLIAFAAPRARGAVARAEESEESDLLSARAAALGAWGVVAGKVGIEANLVHYAGGGGVVDPGGRWMVRAPADQPGLISYTIDVDAAPGPVRPATAGAALPGGRPALRGIVAAAALASSPSAVDLMERVRAAVNSAVASGARVVVLPDLAGRDTRSVTAEEVLPLLHDLSTESATLLTVALAERSGGRTYKTAFAIGDGRTLAAHRQCVLDADEVAAGFSAGTDAPPIVTSPLGPIALLVGAEGISLTTPPGAGATLWCAGDALAPVSPTARTRALEDGAPVVAAGSTASHAGAVVIDGTGTVLMATPPEATMVAVARIG